VLSAVAFTKAAIASARVGGTGGRFGVDSLPLERPAASWDRVLDGICGNNYLKEKQILYARDKTFQITLPKRVMYRLNFTTGYITQHTIHYLLYNSTIYNTLLLFFYYYTTTSTAGYS
jgi:hypothetical protein